MSLSFYPMREQNFLAAIDYLTQLAQGNSSELTNKHLTEDVDVSVSFGERHGSWFVKYKWSAEGLVRIVEISFANPEPVSDSLSARVNYEIVYGGSSPEEYVVRELKSSSATISVKLWNKFEPLFDSAFEKVKNLSIGDLNTPYHLSIRSGQ